MVALRSEVMTLFRIDYLLNEYVIDPNTLLLHRRF